MDIVPRSLVQATEIDVLPPDRMVTRRGDHLIVCSPGNPHHWWGNYLVFDDAPRPGDGDRWEAAFDEAFAAVPGVEHRAFGWDRTDGAAGAAAEELGGRGYKLEWTAGLVAVPAEITPHPRANQEIEVRRLDPYGDEPLWAGALAVQLANNAADPEPIERFEPFARARQRDLRALFAAGRGAWYAAIDPASRRVVAGCGVVATDTRGRYQAVDTEPSYRRRGIASRLVAEAAADASAAHRLASLVIAADPDYHAIGIYESLGFRRAELLCGAVRAP